MHLFETVTPETTILTPNLRLSVSLAKQYQQRQIAANVVSWPTLAITEITKWLQRLWHTETAKQIADFSVLLTPLQEQIVWEEILKQTSEHELLQLSSTAELARAAWGILKQWQVKLDNPALATTEDSQVFLQWAQQFQQRCHAENWLDSHSLADWVLQKIQQRALTLPSHLIVTGFAELTPQQQAIFHACEDNGTRIDYDTALPTIRQVHRITLTDKETEIVTMARWAKTLYDQTDHATIACVIPGLEDERERVLRLFTEVFVTPNTYTLDHTTLPFNISAGRHLSSYPIVHTALQILQLGHSKLTLSTLSHLLHSPFIGDAERECVARAKLDASLRNDNVTSLTLKELLQKKAIQTCPQLATRIQHYLDLLPRKSIKQSVSTWVQCGVALLNAWGWPGERSINSPEYQTATAWLNLLGEYSRFDTLLATVPFNEAMHYLTYLAHKAMFQPESPTARIQILGPLEAAAIPFDYSWVMGLDDSAWPQAPKPNPFIPQRLQKTLQMPRASADRELTYAKYITEQFKAHADVVIFSHAHQNDDAELRTSPLIVDLPETTLDALSLAAYQSTALQIFAHRAVDYWQDDVAPAIQATEVVRGGASIFKNQALCPFKAFAELRLHARKIEPPTPGLRPKDRGDIVHIAMEQLWLELQTQAALLQLTPAALTERIQHHVNAAIQQVAEVAQNNKRYLDLESQRLQKLLGEWFELEKQRPDFTIHALEQEQQSVFGNIPITVRADRIDNVEDGKKIIIDYKTGKNSPSRDWFDARPNEPQLPLYCILDADNTTGILFAQIHPEEMKWKGISATPLGIESVKTLVDEKNTEATNWAEQITAWRTTLEKLGDDFYHGKANVDPKHPVETCQYCHLQPLCRSHETITEPL